VLGFAFSPTGKYLTIVEKGRARTIDADNPTKVLRPGPEAMPGVFWVEPDRFFTMYPTKGFSMTIDNGGLANPHQMRVHAIQGASDNLHFVAYGEETWICRTNPQGTMVWQNGRLPINVESTCVAFVPGALTFAVATVDKKIQMIDAITKTIVKSFENSNEKTSVLTFTPAGDRLLSAGDDGNVHIWDVGTGKEVHRFAAGSKGVASMVVIGDGKQIVTGGADGSIRIWAMPRAKIAKS
jgi:hypothetical protein